MSEGFDFLGFHIQWRRKFGTDKWHVYTFIADRPVRQLKDKIRALTRRTSQQKLRDVLIRLGPIMRGWANYFKHAVCKHTLPQPRALRVARDQVADAAAPLEVEGRPPLASPTPPAGGSRPSADGIALFNIAACRSPATDTAATRSPTPGISHHA